MITVTAYLGIEFMRDLVSKAGIRGRSSIYTVSGSGNHSFKPQSMGEAGLRNPTGSTNELSQTKNTKMSESDLSNSELKKQKSIIKKKLSSTIRKKNSSTTLGSNSATSSATNTATKKSSSKLKKSKENIPDINVLVESSSRPTSNTNQQKTSRSAAKVIN